MTDVLVRYREIVDAAVDGPWKHHRVYEDSDEHGPLRGSLPPGEAAVVFFGANDVVSAPDDAFLAKESQGEDPFDCERPNARLVALHDPIFARAVIRLYEAARYARMLGGHRELDRVVEEFEALLKGRIGE